MKSHTIEVSASVSWPLVLIEWEESRRPAAEWVFIDETVPNMIICKSVGWLIRDGSDCKVVMPHLGLATEHKAAYQGTGDIVIPTKSIRHIAILEEVSRTENIPSGGGPCKICRHARRWDIDHALKSAESLRKIAARFGVSPSSLRRHRSANH